MTAPWRGALISRLKELSALTDPGEPDFAREVVDAFLADVPIRVAALRDAVAAGDPQRARVAVHTLKGLCLNVGADHVAGLCKDLEAEIQTSPSLATSSGSVDAIEGDLGLVREFLGTSPWED